MIEWLLCPGNQTDTIRSVIGQAWSGTGQIRLLTNKNGDRQITVVVPENITAKRKPRFPDVLSDWVDIYEEPIFPSPRLPVAAEVVSEHGPDCLALFADLGAPEGACGGIAFYEKGGIVELEQVGKAAVAWRKGQPLSRPSAGDARSQLASAGKALSKSQTDMELFERIEAGRSATAEQILARALLRVMGKNPPTIPELSQIIQAARGFRLSV